MADAGGAGSGKGKGRVLGGVMANTLPPDIFIFNEKNKGFLDGSIRQLGGRGAIEATLKFLILLFLTIALPIGILIAVAFAFITQVAFSDLIVWQAIIMLVISLFMSYAAYRFRRKLEAEGQILVGEVADYNIRPNISLSGYKKSPRLKYWFLSPTGKIIYGYTLMPPRNLTHLPDGRELPQFGTPVAVLYVDDKRHTVL
jgi:hypothetical protein